jgi:hypothetical protein
MLGNIFSAPLTSIIGVLSIAAGAVLQITTQVPEVTLPPVVVTCAQGILLLFAKDPKKRDLPY